MQPPSHRVTDRPLAPDDGFIPLCERISISPRGRMWAISHDGSYLGYAPSSEEATRIGRHLAEWFIGQGRAADVVIDLAPLIPLDGGPGWGWEERPGR